MLRLYIAAVVCTVFWTVFLLSEPSHAQHYLISSRFDESPSPPKPDYSEQDNWCALPHRVDEADQTPKGHQAIGANALADVFYVHPTLYSDQPKTEFKWNQDIRDLELNRQVDELPIRYQATAFNAAGQVYAPRYRQAHYSVFLTNHLDDKKKALDLAYADVAAAFDYYVQHYNQGRPFLLAGHSQGTLHLARLLKHRIIGTPLQQRLVAAYLPGMPIPADSLAGLPVCVDSTATGCWTSWRTFQWGYQPKQSTVLNSEPVCVNPISWIYEATGQGDSLQAYVSRHHHKGAVVKPFGRIYPRRCDAAVYSGVLWVHRPRFPGSFLIRSSNYHAGDINLFYMDVRHNAALRVRQFIEDMRQ